MERDFDRESIWVPPEPDKGSAEERPELQPRLEEVHEVTSTPPRPEVVPRAELDPEERRERIDTGVKEEIIKRKNNGENIDVAEIQRIKERVKNTWDPEGLTEDLDDEEDGGPQPTKH